MKKFKKLIRVFCLIKGLDIPSLQAENLPLTEQKRIIEILNSALAFPEPILFKGPEVFLKKTLPAKQRSAVTHEKEANSLTSLDNQKMLSEIQQYGGIEEYTKAIYMYDDESDPEFEKSVQDIEKEKKLYKKDSASSFSADIPSKNTCTPLMQSINSGACNLYSFLGAALNVKPFRDQLEKLIVKEDGAFVYIKFPYLGPAKRPAKFKKIFDTTYKVSKEIYYSNTGGLLPSKDSWVQAVSRAFYEHLQALGAASPDGYDLIYPIDNGNNTENRELFFGTKPEILDIKGPCILNETEQSTDSSQPSCKEGLILKNNGIIEIRSAGSEQQLDGKNTILIVPAPGHARTIYYDENKWKFFDNQSSSQGKCGTDVTNNRSSLNSTYQVQIISLK